VSGIRVRLHAPRGLGPDGPSGFPEGFSADLTMPAVPRVGETIAIGEPDTESEHIYRIHGVHWYPHADDYDVYIVLRD
jgi:hypothetical protein